MTHREALNARFQAIPPEKFARKLKRTGTGLVVAATGPLLKLFVVDTLPWTIIVAFVAIGFLTVSGELLMAPIRLAIATLRDLLAALGTRNAG